MLNVDLELESKVSLGQTCFLVFPPSHVLYRNFVLCPPLPLLQARLPLGALLPRAARGRLQGGVRAPRLLPKVGLQVRGEVVEAGSRKLLTIVVGE